MEELEQLKSVLRSLVVSSPTQMDMRALLKDYRNIMGEAVPISKYGYRNAYDFLKERCNDCFLLHGPLSNPVLTLIVPDALKHIDKHVQKQRIPSGAKGKCKRRSVPVAAIKPQESRVNPLLTEKNTYSAPRHPIEYHAPPVNRSNHHNNENEVTTRFRPKSVDIPSPPATNMINNQRKHNNEYEVTTQFKPKSVDICSKPNNYYEPEEKVVIPPKKAEVKIPVASYADVNSNEKCRSVGEIGRMEKMLKIKMSQLHLALTDDSGSEQGLTDRCSLPSKDDNDSGRQTASSGSSSLGRKKTSLDEINEQIVALVSKFPEGVWSMDLIRLYREAHGRDIPFVRLGHCSVTALLVTLKGVAVTRPPLCGDWRITLPLVQPLPRVSITSTTPLCESSRPAATRAEPDDALPGLDFQEGVFPADCVQWAECIARTDVSAWRRGDMVAVCVAEVYSPAHCWLQPLSTQPTLYRLMDACNEYYNEGAGRSRSVCFGALRAGHYCAAQFEGEWHRAVILRREEPDIVTVRHIDYGTVSRVRRDALRPLLRHFATLPQQAIRARLAGIRPVGSPRYSLAAATRLLELVRDKRLVANVAAVDTQERILEVILVDTSSAEDVNIGDELVRSGLAARRADLALLTLEAHLRPTFDSLERGAAPPLGDLMACSRSGISLALVPAHELHVCERASQRAWRRVRTRTCEPDEPRHQGARRAASVPPPPRPCRSVPRRARSHPRAAERRAASSPVAPLPLCPLPPLNWPPAASPSPPPAPRPLPVPPPPPPPPAETKIEMPLPPPGYPAPLHYFPPRPHFIVSSYPAPFLPAPYWAGCRLPPPPPPHAVCAVSLVECEVFVRVCSVDVRTACMHMAAALVRPPPCAPTLSLRTLDVAVFRKLWQHDPATAAAHLHAAITRAMSPSSPSPTPSPTIPPSSLNPEAREFSLVSTQTQTPPPACLRPPPGYENYVPTPLTD